MTWKRFFRTAPQGTAKLPFELTAVLPSVRKAPHVPKVQYGARKYTPLFPLFQNDPVLFLLPEPSVITWTGA